jgi:hypothetical protein
MPSLVKASSHARGERRTCLLRRTIGAKVYGATDDWRLAIWKLMRAVTPMSCWALSADVELASLGLSSPAKSRHERIAWRVSFTIGVALVAAARPGVVLLPRRAPRSKQDRPDVFGRRRFARAGGMVDATIIERL